MICFVLHAQQELFILPLSREIYDTFSVLGLNLAAMQAYYYTFPFFMYKLEYDRLSVFPRYVCLDRRQKL